VGLAQYSEVGYHLGQIKEKHGNKDEAIHLYALASWPTVRCRKRVRAWIGLAGKDKSEALMKIAKR